MSQATMDLFRDLATATAERRSFPYPAEEDRHVSGWVRSALEGR